MMNALTFSLFPRFGRAGFVVINPEGIREDENMVTDVFHGLLSAAALRLQNQGLNEEANDFLACVPKEVTLDLEGMLMAGYRLEGVPAQVWDLIKTK